MPFNLGEFLHEAFCPSMEKMTVVAGPKLINENDDEPIFDVAVMCGDRNVHVILQWNAPRNSIIVYADSDALDFYPRFTVELEHSDIDVEGALAQLGDDEDDDGLAAYVVSEVFIPPEVDETPYRSWLLRYLEHVSHVLCKEYCDQAEKTERSLGEGGTLPVSDTRH